MALPAALNELFPADPSLARLPAGDQIARVEGNTVPGR